MKRIYQNDNGVQIAKAFWTNKTRFFFIIGMVVVVGVYVLVVRDFLLPSMLTVPVELTVAGILLLFLVLALLAIMVTLLILVVVAVLPRFRSKVRSWLVRLRGEVVVAMELLAVFSLVTFGSQLLAYTPPIVGEDGEAVAGSVAKLEQVKLGDSEQWISVRGESVDNPVLLFLAGGPGGSQMGATRKMLGELEKDFVVVNWEQPGSGKSYDAVPLKSITPERYMADGHELTKYLQEEFAEEKIYLLGDSWGSALGIWLADKYPEDYAAFIGSAQMVDFAETEELCYDFALKLAEEKGDTARVEKLESQGRPPYYGDDVIWKESAYLMYLSSYMANHPDMANPGYDTLGDLASPEYGVYDKLNYVRGTLYTFNHVYQQLYEFDLREQVKKVEVPVFFMEGRYDVNAPPALVEEYYQILDAPHKEIIWFEHSGHNPWMNEPEKYVEKVNDILEKTR